MPSKFNATAVRSGDLQGRPRSSRGDGMSGRFSDIFQHAAILTLPMLLLSGVLIGLVVGFRLQVDPHFGNNLLTPYNSNQDNALLVNFSATRLAFVASWSSSVATLLSSSVMALWSYHASSSLIKAVASRNPLTLPTPYQFGLLLTMLSAGGVGRLWTWTKYMSCWGRRRQHLGRIVSLTTTVLLTTLLLSLLVIAADTWFHNAVETIVHTQSIAIDSPPAYSNVLRDRCWNQTFHNGEFPCSIDVDTDRTNLSYPSASQRTFNNVSDTMTVATYYSDPPYAYLAPPAVLDPKAVIDFRASTFAAQTQCKMISEQCRLQPDQGGIFYNCTAGLRGGAAIRGYVADWTNITYFTAETFKDELSIYTFRLSRNPLNFGWVANTDSSAGGSENRDLVRSYDGSYWMVLGCQSTIFDVVYDNINGSTTNFNAKPSNNSLAAMVVAAMDLTRTPDAYLHSNTILAALNNDSDAIAYNMGLVYSRAALSVIAGTFVRGPVLLAQTRDTLLVTRVPLAPLYALLAANLAFVVAGICLTVSALFVSRGLVREVQARLSIPGLVAERFERDNGRKVVKNIEDLFDEHRGDDVVRVTFDYDRDRGYSFMPEYRESLLVGEPRSDTVDRG